MVRIIGGVYRGKKLHFPAAPGLRPTPARVRETLFNWLMQKIRGSKCLDAFAGSGALGFEAFSRGAKSVTLLEKSPQVFTNLARLTEQFDTKDLHVLCIDALQFITQHKACFDVIFFDPPFALFATLPTIFFKTLNSRLSQEGLLYLESPGPIPLDPLDWHLLKSKQAGAVTYSLYQKTS